MQLDPVVVALGGAVTTLAGIVYRELVRGRNRAEADADWWRRRALGMTGLAQIATDEAEEHR